MPIDPKDDTNQRHTDELLEKSKTLKQKAKATSDKLDELKAQSGKLTAREKDSPAKS